MKLYQKLATLVVARANCITSKNAEWQERHEEEIKKLVLEHLPSGSGFDAGTTLDLGMSTPEKLVFKTGYHHMTEFGFYDGWTEHLVFARPSLAFGYFLTVTGNNRNDIKGYIMECFDEALNREFVL